MEIVPKLEGAELEFNGDIGTYRGMSDRYVKVKQTKRGVDRASVAQAIVDAFTLIGGVPAFALWAQDPEHRTDFYKLYAKQAPTNLEVRGTFEIISPLPRNSALDGEFHELDQSGNQAPGSPPRSLEHTSGPVHPA